MLVVASLFRIITHLQTLLNASHCAVLKPPSIENHALRRNITSLIWFKLPLTFSKFWWSEKVSHLEDGNSKSNHSTRVEEKERVGKFVRRRKPQHRHGY